MENGYTKAKQLGKRAFREAALRGRRPNIEVLEDICGSTLIANGQHLGIFEIPIDQIAGTRMASRAESFACNFMPLLSEGSEFARKWETLYQSQLEEGIRDAVRVYEYNDRFYVEEGNKRVSVMRFLGASDILAEVTRIQPKEEALRRDPKVYAEYLAFNRVTRLFELLFTKPGAYEAVAWRFGADLSHVWNMEMIRKLKSALHRFRSARCAQLASMPVFLRDKREAAMMPEALSDAFFTYLSIYGTEKLFSGTSEEIAAQLESAEPELRLIGRDEPVRLVEEPQDVQPVRRIVRKNLFELLFARGDTGQRLRIAFLNAETAKISRLTYGHMLGVSALLDRYGDEVEVLQYDNCSSMETTRAALLEAAKAGSSIIFMTAGQMAPGLLDFVLEHPEIRFFDHSMQAAFGSVQTYFARSYEAKFLLGMIAAEMAKDRRIGYYADPTDQGRVAALNAFALGVQFIDPDARILVSEDPSWFRTLLSENLHIIDGPDLRAPEEKKGPFGLFRYRGGVYQGERQEEVSGERYQEGIFPDGTACFEHLAMPVVNWGCYYELLTASVLDGSFDASVKAAGDRAVSFFYGMSAGVVDVFCSNRLPRALRRTADTLKELIRNGSLSPFSGELRSQDGQLQTAPGEKLPPAKIMQIGWLNENIEFVEPAPGTGAGLSGYLQMKKEDRA